MSYIDSSPVLVSEEEFQVEPKVELANFEGDSWLVGYMDHLKVKGEDESVEVVAVQSDENGVFPPGVNLVSTSTKDLDLDNIFKTEDQLEPRTRPLVRSMAMEPILQSIQLKL